MVSDISRGHKEIIQLTQGKGRRQLYVWSAEEVREQKSEGHLAQKHCVLVTDRGRRVCARCITDEDAYQANDIFSNVNT